ncbi:MAG: DUF4159 domain-containing protein [Phycisphaerae bacterium]|nr:DUF4159 domain-containing protein [Phycisphaerae bacterium]
MITYGQLVTRLGALSLGLCLLHGPLTLDARADVTGEQVRRAIRDGVKIIQLQQLADGTWVNRCYPGGTTCLATLALLQAGESVDSEAVAAALAAIRRLPNQSTYVVSLKIMVLAKADPTEYRPEINLATRWLITAQNKSGLWGYTEVGDRFDHSNTQFALLGLHAASQVGVKIPAGVWKKAQTAIIRNQQSDGGWSYQSKGTSYGSMTAAGVADLIIFGNTLREGQERGFRDGAAPNCGKYRINRPLAKGLAWLSRNFRAGSNPGRHDHYYYWLYAVERCGILSGQRYFGRHDWYRAGASILVKTQSPTGEWNNSLTDTCFAILFLAKGHKALLIQKLQWSDDDAWTPDRYDVPHLIAYIGDQLGEPVTWQVVPFDAPLEEWLAAPLLYFHGHTFPQWNDQQRAKLRAFVEQGGTILAEACCGREEFRRGFESFAAATFPEVPLHELGRAHAVYRVLHKVEPYGLKGIDLGCRTSVIYSPNDMSCLWEQAKVAKISEQAFKIGTNIAAYAVGRRPLRDRLDVVVIPEMKEGEQPSGPPPQDAFRLAQVVYDGDWRPFPPALVGLAEFMRDELDFDVVTQDRQVRLTDDALYTCPILVLAGHFEFELSATEREALAAHLRRGGFLIADACCGTKPFDGSFRQLVQQTFPDAELERLPADHPIFVGTPGFDVTTVGYTPDVLRQQPTLRAPELWGLRVAGRLAVVYSPYSLSCGLSGSAFDGCWGLVSEDARRLAANIVLYALTH